MRKSSIALICFGVIAAVVLGWYFYPTIVPISVHRPLADTPKLQPLPPSNSTLSLPITISIKSFEDYLNKIAPKSERGTHPVRVLGTWIGNIRWSITRTPISITAQKGKLHLASRIKGSVRYGVGVDIAANATASTRVSIDPNWRVSMPELRLAAQLSEAKLFKRISVKSLLQGPANRLMRKLGDQIRKSLATDPFLENEARRAWAEVCGAFLVDKESDLWISVKPLALRTASPIVDDTAVRLQLGLDAETKLVTSREDIECKFPKQLATDPPQPGRLNLMLAAQVDYGWLSNLLINRAKGEVTFQDVHVEIKDIGVRPHGNSLLLEVNLAARVGKWFGKRAEGTIYVLAKPVLETESQIIFMSDLELDTQSRSALVAILGEVVEPVLLDILNANSTVDLKPQIQKMRARSKKMFEGISGGGFEVDGQVESIELKRIDVGRENLRVVSKMGASIGATIRKIQLGR